MEQTTNKQQTKGFQMTFHKISTKGNLTITLWKAFLLIGHRKKGEIEKKDSKNSEKSNFSPQTQELSKPTSFQNFKPPKTSKNNSIMNIIWITLKTIFCCFSCFSKRNSRQKTLMRIKTKLYTLPILSFFNRLVLVLRAMGKFRNQTIFRTPKNLKNFDYYLIDDVSYMPNTEHQNNVSENFVFKIFRFFSSKLSKGLRKNIKACLQKIFVLLSKIKILNLKKFLNY